MTFHVVAISGSLRKSSTNTMALRAAQRLAPEGMAIEIVDIADIPFYNDDVRAAGEPASVTALKAKIAASDAVLIATPEYNFSIPGVLKNAFDWMSRPPADSARVFSGKPVALIGASPGGFGTILAQDAWLGVLRTLGTRPWFGQKLLVSRAGTLFDAEGDLTDGKSRDQLRDYLAAFVSAIR